VSQEVKPTALSGGCRNIGTGVLELSGLESYWLDSLNFLAPQI
jgi:hypothetical protein